MTQQLGSEDVEAIRQEAADWFVRLNADDAAEADWLAFGEWIGRGEEQAASFRAVEAAWVDLDQIQSGGLANAPAPLPIRIRPKPSRFWPAIAAGMAAVLVALGLGLVIHRDQGGRTVVATRDQEVAAPGGGRIRLSAGASLTLRRTSNGVLATLERGRVRFEIRHDPSRRFTVDAGAVTLTDVGTVFEVVRREEGVSVQVRDGEVALAQSGGGGNVLAVGRGEGARYSEGEPGARLTGPDGAPLRRVFDGAPLSQVLAAINAAYTRPVRIGPHVGDPRFTGVLQFESEAPTVERLAAFLNLKARWAGAGYELDTGGPEDR